MVYLKLQVSGGLGTAVPQTSPYWTFGIFLLAACLGFQEAQGLVLHCLAMFIVIHICEMSTDFNWLFHPPLKFELLHKARLKLPSWPCFIFSSFILDFSLPIVRGGNSVEGFSVVQIVQQVSQRRSDPQQWKETVPCLPAISVCRAWGFSWQIPRVSRALHSLHSCRSWAWQFTAPVHPLQHFTVMTITSMNSGGTNMHFLTRKPS